MKVDGSQFSKSNTEVLISGNLLVSGSVYAAWKFEVIKTYWSDVVTAKLSWGIQLVAPAIHCLNLMNTTLCPTKGVDQGESSQLSEHWMCDFLCYGIYKAGLICPIGTVIPKLSSLGLLWPQRKWTSQVLQHVFHRFPLWNVAPLVTKNISYRWISDCSW